MYAVNFANTLTGWLGRRLIQNVLYVINLATFSTLALRDWDILFSDFDTFPSL